MRYYESYQELIGGTPLVRLNHMDFPAKLNVFAKMELLNPSGSLKDRTCKAIIAAAEKAGSLKRGDTIVEITSGNTGISFAFVGLNKGYKFIFVVPEKFSQEKNDIMRALGARIINTPLEKGMEGAFEKVRELLHQDPHMVYLDQFSHAANPRVHRETTGVEIYQDLDGQVDQLVAGAGTGGTFSGVLEYLKSKNPQILGILADPIGSTMGGGTGASYLIEGIGNCFMPSTMNMAIVDEVYKISDAEAFAAARLLAVREGILAGSSSGAVLAAAKKFAQKGATGNMVVILADRGDRYLSKDLYSQ